MSGTAPHVRRAIEALKELISLAASDVEHKLGGPLTHEAAAALRGWLARAFEAGMDAGRPSPAAQSRHRVQAYLAKLAQLHLTREALVRAEILGDLDRQWKLLTPAEREEVARRRNP